MANFFGLVTEKEEGSVIYRPRFGGDVVMPKNIADKTKFRKNGLIDRRYKNKEFNEWAIEITCRVLHY